MAGTPRDEAERLVAAVLAMAGPAGAGDKVGERVAAGLSALSDTVSGFLGSLSDNGAGREGADDKDAPVQTGDAASRDSSGGSGAGSSSGGSSSGAGSSGSSSGAGSSSGGSGGSGSGSRHQGGAWATGSAECCVCPVCRAISTMRDPSPETAVKLAIGAGDLATGVASMMRAFSSIVGRRTPAKPPAARRRPRNRDENWSVATRTTNRPEDAWSAATNAAPTAPAPTAPAPTAPAPARQTKDADSWSAATTASAAEASAEHAAQAAARAARRAAERAAQREAALAASRRAKEAAARVAEAVRLAEAARDLQNAGSDPALAEGPGAGDRAGGARPAQRTPRKRDVWAAATADAGVADAAGGATLDHDVPGTEAGDEARGGGTA